MWADKKQKQKNKQTKTKSKHYINIGYFDHVTKME